MTSCDSEPRLSLETAEKDKLVKGYGAQKNSASKSYFKMDRTVKVEIWKSENRSVSHQIFQSGCF